MAKKQPMTTPMRIGLYAAVSVLGVALILATVYIITGSTPSSSEPFPNNLTPGETSSTVTSQPPPDLLLALQQLEDVLLATPLTIQINESRFVLDPESVGFDLDENAFLDELEQNQSSQTPAQLIQNWLENTQSSQSRRFPGSVNERAIGRLLNNYEMEALDVPFNGAITIVGGAPTAEYPHPGEKVERVKALESVTSTLLTVPRVESLTLQVNNQAPDLSVSAVARALSEAQSMLAGPVTLTIKKEGNDGSDLPPQELDLNQQLLVDAFISQVETDPAPRMELGFDPAFFVVPLETLREKHEDPPVNASVTTDRDDNIVIIEGKPGTVLDPELAAEAAAQAARQVDRTAELQVKVGAEPEITTEDIRALGIKERLSSATTQFPCCQPRVTNIQLFADTMDHTIVLPGETLSLNETVGERTREKGYRPAPTIIQGRIEDTVGGGVSQFATTFYNALFDAGMEDIQHQTHSYYFTRYPEGIEATISWQEPDLVFRNNTQAAVLIRTSYTDTSVTVKFFGDNGGLEIRRWTSSRYAFTEPPTDYFPNPELLPSEGEVETNEGREGWSVTVGRIITHPDGTSNEETWRVRYRARPRDVEVHPCLLPPDHEEYVEQECPPEETTTTTTTQPPEETTTTTTTTQPNVTDTTQPIDDTQ